MRAAEPRDRFYGFLRLLGRFWVWFLGTRVDARHLVRVPSEGPVLLCINHPNNLIDSLLVATVLPRQVHYLATASLFRNPLLGRFLRRAGALPVQQRAGDATAPADRNAELFLACRQALREGRVVAIYPEGTTHAETRVQRIRTGAARIALDYAALGEGPPLAVVPAGLSFAARKAFRGRVRLAFGPPVPLEPHRARYARDPVGAVEGLTAAIQAAMAAQVVHVDRVDVAEVARAVEELYRDELAREQGHARGLPESDIDPFPLSRAITEAVGHFAACDPARVERLWRMIRAYRTRLRAHHVRDRAVVALAAPPTDRPRRLPASARALVGLPVFVYGAAVSGLPYLLPRWLARRLARQETDYATIRLLASMVAFPLCWGLETWLVWRMAGPPWAFAFALSLPVTGLPAYRYFIGTGRLWGRLRLAVLAVTHGQTAAGLVAERQRILGELERARRDYLGAGGHGAGDAIERHAARPDGRPTVSAPSMPVNTRSDGRREQGERG